MGVGGAAAGRQQGGGEQQRKWRRDGSFIVSGSRVGLGDQVIAIDAPMPRARRRNAGTLYAGVPAGIPAAANSY